MLEIYVYDVETRHGPDEVDGGWNNPEAMGFATAVAYEFSSDTYHFFEGHEGRRALVKMLDRNTAVTFNGINFDSKILLGNRRSVDGAGLTSGKLEMNVLGYKNRDPHLYRWRNVDILLEYLKSRFKISTIEDAVAKLNEEGIHDGSFNLDGLAAGTLWMAKNGEGAMAPLLYRRGEFAELFEYNLHDVRITRKLFESIMDTGQVVDRQGRHIKIKYSY